MTLLSSTQAYARMMDDDDDLQNMRNEFFIPQTSSFGKNIERPSTDQRDPIIYFAGSAMGLQPRDVLTKTHAFLDQWATQAIQAGFTTLPGCTIPSWLEAEQKATRLMAPIVGAQEKEVVLMGTLTANLHLMLASFYRPAESEEKHRTKIMIEESAFSSDRYAIESQLSLHGFNPSTEIVEIPFDSSTSLLALNTILATIDAHAATTAVLILSAVQFHTGQLLDVAHITAHARSQGIVVGWDLAHAVGNVEMKLHDWDVDFAAWCSYKYLNAGPGATGGAFVHERHLTANRPRLAGWWGASIPQRFALEKIFKPADSARGFQVSSPSILDITALTAALNIFAKSDMRSIANRSRQLTNYLETLLAHLILSLAHNPSEHSRDEPLWTIITPQNSQQRGAMLSLRWHDFRVLEKVVQRLRDAYVIVDIKKPDIMRVTPSPLYSSFEDVWLFIEELKNAVGITLASNMG
ncbi:putative kynureninase [Ophiobolus disseminans]|uniref:Kynureninase n=1 Tax=Ophiobolus disseminans TaxID=1469910 RepID=A0A6A7A889_9PLEO|nr:putative kynureninase [Ophiobolus disseminans]